MAAFSGADLAEEWAAPLVCAWPVTDDIKMSEHWPLAKDKARHAGDGVAVVVAESRVLAKDAAELVEVDWEPLPAVTDPLAAMEDGAPLVHDDFGTNVSSVWGFEKGDSPAPHKTSKPFFDDPDLVKVKHRYRLRRLIPNAMEPRGVRRRAERARWASSRCTPPARSRTSCARRRPSPAASPRPSCAWSPPTSAAASARSSTPTPRSRSAWRSPGG